MVHPMPVNDLCLGIDLGTTMTVAFVWTGQGPPEIVKNRRTGERVTPSVVYFNYKDGKPLVGGRPGGNPGDSHAKFTVDNTKRFIGRYWYDPVVEKLRDGLNY